MNDTERAFILARASWAGIIGNGILAILKIVFGFIASSLALIGDGIDSLTDIITSVISLFTSRLITTPPDREHPWGHGRAETLSTKLLSFIIFFAGSQLAISALKQIFSGEERGLPKSIALWITVISVVGKTLLAIYKFKMGKKSESRLLIADAVNMRNDIFLSLSVFVGISLSLWFHMPILDSITSLILSFFILKSAYGIFMETNAELMDGMEDQEMYHLLFSSLDGVKGLHNPHRCRIRRINNLYDIDLDIEVDGKLSLEEAHEIAIKAEDAVKKNLKNVFDIMIHVEPLGNIEHKEQFGLSPESFSDN